MAPPAAPDTLYVIDGHAQIFRAYYAIRGGMSSPTTGEPTNAIFGFAGMLLKLLLKYQPRYAVMAIDLPGKTFRDDLYPEYKAHRPPPPADLISQEQHIFRMTRMFGIPILSQPGAEADDVIATVTHRVLADTATGGGGAAASAVHVRLVSKDKDLEQLLCDRVTMFDIHTDTTIDAAALLRDKGITPAQVIDTLALMGDSVDNVPGVDGIGPKTAAQLIHEYGSIEGILNNLDKIKGKRHENIEKARAQLTLSRQLVTLKHDLDMPFTLAAARLGPIDAAGVRQLFDQLGFNRHQSDLNRLLKNAPAPLPPEAHPGTAARLDASPAIPGAANVANGPKIRNQTSPNLTSDDSLFAPSLFEAAPPRAEPQEDAPSDPSSIWALGQALVVLPPTIPAGHTTAATGDYRAITTEAQIDDFVATLRAQALIALDTETIGLGHSAALVGLSLAWEPGHAVYVPVRSPQPADHLSPEAVLAKLAPVLNDPGVGKCGHNLKYDLLVLRHAGIEVRGVVFDSMIASHLLGSPAHGLDDLASAHLKHHMMQISELIGLPTSTSPKTGLGRDSQITMDQVPLDQITRYAADDAEVSLRLCHLLQPQLKIQGMELLARDIEMPLIEVLAEMQWHGIRVNPAVLAEQKLALGGRIDALRDQVLATVGFEFNIDSPKQLADVLFKRMGLPVGKRTKTGPSTDIEVLERLADREGLTREQATVPALIVEYRQLTKLVNTYLDALRDSINPRTGRVHAQFHQSGAATGRLSSSDPNLQNIPIRTEVGRQIRRAFIADPGCLLVSADYSQIELRILAHLSGDPKLIEAFEADRDVHAAVAAEVFGVPLDQVTREQRAHAKIINFGIVYGVTAYGLARRIEGLDAERARQLIADYKRRFAGIGTFLEQCVAQAEKLGYVTTIFGRRRAIREVNSPNRGTRALGERLAINSVVQGSAADLMKLAMVHVHRRIQREKLPARLLLQIHDELVLEAPAAQAPAAAKMVVEEMERAMTLRVPLKVEAGVGEDWLAAK